MVLYEKDLMRYIFIGGEANDEEILQLQSDENGDHMIQEPPIVEEESQGVCSVLVVLLLL
jgi:hypothetical protein